jgi:replicative DNA helicase
MYRKDQKPRNLPTGDPFIDKGLPNNLEAERAILGAILLDNNVCDEAMMHMQINDFFLDSHRRIFEKMITLWELGQSIDLVTLSEELRRAQLFERVGGATYIASLIDGVPRTDSVAPYMKIVKGKAILRSLIAAANQIVTVSFDEEESPDEILAIAEKMIYGISEARVVSGFRPVSEIAVERLAATEALSDRPQLINGIPTGYTDFDAMTAGLQRQELIVIAGRPSMGKTAWALGAGLYAAQHGYGVGIFSLEMSAEQLVARLLSSEGRVDAHRIRAGYLNADEWARLADSLRRLTDCRLEIDDTAAITIPEMRAKVRRLKAQFKKAGMEKAKREQIPFIPEAHDLDLLIVDYMQLMSGRGNAENRQQEVSQISRDLKALAKELNVPIVALSQLSRATETRSDHKPQLSDLRESGTIEQDSDVVGFIYRDEVYNPTDENRGLAELIIGKQRNGPTGTVPLAFMKEFTRFENLWRAEEDTRMYEPQIKAVYSGRYDEEDTLD